MNAVIRSILLAVLAFNVASASASEMSDKMMRLLQQGKMLEVYRLGLKYSFTEGGNVEFDYAFGIAAVRVGRPGRAIFALERVLWRQPKNHRARLELARAQFELGNLGSARDEFREVLEYDPPDNVRKNVETYLARIKQRERSLKFRFSSYAELGFQYDTNVNAATSDTQVAVPALGWVTLDSGSTATSGSVGLFETGLTYERLMSKKSAYFGTLDVSMRSVLEDDSLSTISADFKGGFMFGSRKSRLRVPLQYSQMYLAGTAYRQMMFAGLDWTKMLSAENSLSLFLQGGSMQYPTTSARDVTLAVAGGSWAHRFGSKGHTVSVAGHYGQEIAPNAAQWGRSYYGLNANLQWKMGLIDSLNAGLSYQQATHAAVDPVFVVTREDQLLQVTADWSRVHKKKLLLKAELGYTQNLTNIDLYTYDRMQATVSAKYNF